MEPTEQQSHSTTATTTMTTAPLALAQALFDELVASVRGEVYRRGDDQYVSSPPPSLRLLTVVPHFLCSPAY
jgi:hypothetical protein